MRKPGRPSYGKAICFTQWRFVCRQIHRWQTNRPQFLRKFSSSPLSNHSEQCSEQCPIQKVRVANVLVQQFLFFNRKRFHDQSKNADQKCPAIGFWRARYLAAISWSTLLATTTAFLKQGRFSSPQRNCILTNLYSITGYCYHCQVASAFVTPCEKRRTRLYRALSAKSRKW